MLLMVLGGYGGCAEGVPRGVEGIHGGYSGVLLRVLGCVLMVLRTEVGDDEDRECVVV